MASQALDSVLQVADHEKAYATMPALKSVRFDKYICRRYKRCPSPKLHYVELDYPSYKFCCVDQLSLLQILSCWATIPPQVCHAERLSLLKYVVLSYTVPPSSMLCWAILSLP